MHKVDVLSDRLKVWLTSTESVDIQYANLIGNDQRELNINMETQLQRAMDTYENQTDYDPQDPVYLTWNNGTDELLTIQFWDNNQLVTREHIVSDVIFANSMYYCTISYNS